MTPQTRIISKVLSSNDVGLTGAHQAGILVPKKDEILAFFPSLNKMQRNPRVVLSFKDGSGNVWEFAFIYYNNRLFGGTRNEYRLTRMTKYIISNDLKPGDEIVLVNLHNGDRQITYKRKNGTRKAESIRLTGKWKVIKL